MRGMIMRRYDQELLGAPLRFPTARKAIDLRSECQGMIKVVGELDCFSAHIRLREIGKSKDKAEYKVMDCRAMGSAAPWYRRGGTSVESSVAKGAEKVENAEANTKSARPRNEVGNTRYSTKVREKMVQSQRRPGLSKTYSKLRDSKLG
ncbi:hypothetical protein B296_00031853 [Ensete ventricosum]|uniref:Uncharacterized protein n=1 Tax=Ensete ventricosum TaxID=4639 RepID=A0A426YDZ2_ENSVE|nr:hypothetical protein B296_00031853 [Ensete ventricosum]